MYTVNFCVISCTSFFLVSFSHLTDFLRIICSRFKWYYFCICVKNEKNKFCVLIKHCYLMEKTYASLVMAWKVLFGLCSTENTNLLLNFFIIAEYFRSPNRIFIRFFSKFSRIFHLRKHYSTLHWNFLTI